MPMHNATPRDPQAFTTGTGPSVTQFSQLARLLRLTAPLHPILVHFTIALTATAFAFDVFAFLWRLTALRTMGWWTLALAIVITVGTLATGVRSRLRLHVEEGEMRSFLRTHMALGPTLFGLMVAMGIWRGLLWQAGSGVTGWYLVAIAGVTLVMIVQGYIGGELVYRYGAEVKVHPRRLSGQVVPFPRLPVARSAAGAPERKS